MVVQSDQEPAEVNPATLAPLWNEAEFAEEINAMVAEEAPRLFAVVQEYGERVDIRVAAWGMAFENRVKVFAVDRSLHLSLRSPERAVRAFTHAPHITAHLVWINPDPGSQ
ncbi:MAG: hypothetical protein ACRDRW_07655 [Pseudonocardiaceae bacterium]